MRLHSSRLLVPLVCAVVLLVFLFALLILRAAAPTQSAVVWSAAPSDFSASDQQAIERALVQVLDVTYHDQLSATFAIVSVQRQGDFAVLSVTEQTGSAGADNPVPFTVLAQKQSSTWSVWIQASGRFCDEALSMPDVLMTPEELQLFGCE